jgi:hypothetical protein
MMDEHLAALECCCNTSPGPDSIHKQMLTHPSPAGKEFLLSIFDCTRYDKKYLGQNFFQEITNSIEVTAM